MKILVSACLLGENCKYNGGSNYAPQVIRYLAGKEVVAVCPEMLAGLGCPRRPVEIVEGVLMDRAGNRVEEALRRGAARGLEIARAEGIDQAVLQSRSPTCGVNQVYDGTFTGRLIPGSGVFAQMLREAGYPVLDAEDLP